MIVALKGTEIVEKSNELNEIRMNGMTLQQLRFFSIYLAKINSRDEKTRKVVFPIKDFQKIMELGRVNIKHLQTVTDGLLCKTYNQKNDDGGYTGFVIFKRCRVFRKNAEDWFIEIEASDDALPLMFNIRRNYFKYELWNALRLKSANQIAMYELLKQYEKLGKYEVSVTKLRERLDIITEYPRWNNFKVRVLDSCQQALTETTDITYTYERGKVGNGGKWLTVIFYIKKNKHYIDQLTLGEFINLQDEPEEAVFIDELSDIENENQKYFENERLELYSDMCDNEFNEQEIQIIYDFLLDIMPYVDELKKADYLKRAYDELNYRSTQSKISNRFKYLRGILKNKLEEKGQ